MKKKIKQIELRQNIKIAIVLFLISFVIFTADAIDTHPVIYPILWILSYVGVIEFYTDVKKDEKLLHKMKQLNIKTYPYKDIAA